MRVAILNDIHGNLSALEAVIEQIAREPVDRIVVGGDVVPGPLSRECLELLDALDLPVAFIRGNGENDVLTASRGETPMRVPESFRSVVIWAAEQAGPAGVAAFESWPATLELQPAEGTRVLVCHATPTDDNEIFTERTAESALRSHFSNVGAEVVVCGHTHMQFDRVIGSVRVINAGSVGLPFGEPGAYWLMIDGESFELRRTIYDFEAAARLIADTDYPLPLPLTNPPDAEEMRALFESRSVAADPS